VSKPFRFISALGAVFVALVGLAACGGSSGIPSDAVVKVGDVPISQEAFKHWLRIATLSGASGEITNPAPPEPPNYTACIKRFNEIQKISRKGKKPLTEAELKTQCETQYKSYKQEVLGFLISSQWVLSEADRLGVKVSDSEVKKQFNKIKSQQFPRQAEFQKFLQTSGQSVSDLLLRVRLNLLSQKIQQKITKKGQVSNAQAEKYYNNNKSKYGASEKRSVRLLSTKTEAEAAKAKKEVQSGQSFTAVAKRVSTDPTAKVNGGVLNGVVKGQEEQTLDNAIFSAQKGVLSGPLKTPFGYYVYEVTSIAPGSQQSYAQAKQSIKTQLAATQGQEALTKFVKEFKARWKAKTDCRAAYQVADCKQAATPKTGTTSTG
jgi:parvulin-like peptidyl-prolyl isomerase